MGITIMRPGELVKLRVMPGPEGMVKSSPLALRQTRLPSGKGYLMRLCLQQKAAQYARLRNLH